MRALLLGALLVTSAAGCALTSPCMRPSAPGAALRPQPGKALIVFLRERNACRIPLDVFDSNLSWMGAVDGKSYFAVEMDPGEQQVYVLAAQRGVWFIGSAAISGTLAPDRVYHVALDAHDAFVGCKVEAHALSGSDASAKLGALSALTVQDRRQGQYEFDLRAVRQSSPNVVNAVARARTENAQDSAVARAHTFVE